MVLHFRGFVYGELELFLSGLDLGNLIETFQQNQVTFAQFLRMTDADLQQVRHRDMWWGRSWNCLGKLRCLYDVFNQSS